jgi:hypothetical protein
VSSGLGQLERAVLAYLADQARRDPGRATRLDVIVLAVGRHPESVRRAVKSLARKGSVALGWDNGWRDHGEGPATFWPRGTPTARLSAGCLSALAETEH